MTDCTCEFKEQMIAEMLELRKNDTGDEYWWVPLLFKKPKDHSLCCLLTFLFYYAYCNECATPLSEEARNVLKPPMERETR